MPEMGLDNMEFATTTLFKRSILLKLKQLFAQFDDREIEFYVIIKFLKDNKKICNYILYEINCRFTRIESRRKY